MRPSLPRSAKIVALVVVGLAAAMIVPRAISRVCHAHTCSATAPSLEAFDAERWQCPGPHRIAIARSLVDQRRLVGLTLHDAVALLGPTDRDKDGDTGWELGEPDGSPSLFPNDTLLGIGVDASGHITAARLVDELEGPTMAEKPN